jgi:preprotein translocase subunit SecA
MFNATNTAIYSLTGLYPEKQIPKESWIDRMGIKAYGKLLESLRSDLRRYRRFARKVKKIGKKLAKQSDDELFEFAKTLKTELRRQGFANRKLAAQSFAVIRETSHRKLNMRHFDVQIIGGYVMLNGMVSEMETGEGKTLTATLTAATVAMSGIPVHIVTVNDYLAKRDAQLMSSVYNALGLGVGVIQQDMTPAERQHAYAQDITYCTNNELTFDYLKDRIVIGTNPSRTRMQLERLYGAKTKNDKLLLRGLHFAIIDEADSVLVDEARTPLIISNSTDNKDEREMYEQALQLSESLKEKDDYVIEKLEHGIYLTESGKRNLETMAGQVGGIWSGKQRREELVLRALTARLLFFKDKHYIVEDDKVQIVDEFTGRVMGDRSWEQGLHQMIEAKEGVELTGQRETLAKISYQRFFRKYLHLSGMTGTAREVRSELWSVYRMTTVKIPTNKRKKRRSHGKRVYASVSHKWEAVVNRIEKIHKKQRPVLVGTRSVEDSEYLSRLLEEKGLEHKVLNARQNETEAEIIAQAGELKKITVATNMAGRGTDIKLDAEVRKLGGLHVIVTELHESKRIDRQLIGRCARQGDRGSFECLLSIDDEIATTYANKIYYLFAKNAFRLKLPLARMLAISCLHNGQKSAEKRNSSIREELLRADEKQDTALAFTGRFS